MPNSTIQNGSTPPSPTVPTTDTLKSDASAAVQGRMPVLGPDRQHRRAEQRRCQRQRGQREQDIEHALHDTALSAAITAPQSMP